MKRNPNWIRGKRQLKTVIHCPDDLIRLWRLYGSYNYGAPEIETIPEHGWWTTH